MILHLDMVLLVRVPPLLLGLWLTTASMPDIFHKAKEQFQLGAYEQALKTLETLDAESQQPGAERERSALLPALLFYRGASLAALGHAEEARSSFEQYLALQPNGQIDPGRYPRSVVAAFESARKSVEHTRNGPRVEAPLAAAYSAFPKPELVEAEAAGEDWASGPVRHLLSPEEKRSFAALSDAISRSEFVANFWKSRDQTPETPANEFREEFARRVVFCDARFTQDEMRGSLTDRGMVFILLGPPSYSGRKPLMTGDDIADSSGLSLYSRAVVESAGKGGKTNTSRVAQMDKVSGPGTKIQDAASNWVEVWHYLRRDMPKAFPYQELEFQFVTKVGYGKSVLQRDETPLNALDRARRSLAH